ncbi:splicing factor U2AF 26 kDa subunit-like [Penaeus monodon]|uniref:splicing factor U2AF 26 kDa subunit-like n=1 Tax=Penaeus monodon TaxID=6687 RepID=UPI0018A7D7BF|nr:splicing factor U2AF 26 kDa subunit-like [Penaeus monodon]
MILDIKTVFLSFLNPPQDSYKHVKIMFSVIYICIKSGLGFYTGQFIIFCHASDAVAKSCVDSEGFIQFYYSLRRPFSYGHTSLTACSTLQTVLILNLYCNPQNSAKSADGSHSTVSDEEMQEHYDNFFEEVFVECEDRYGEIEEMNVCDNLGDHLVGNVYIKFKYEEDAEKAVVDLNNRWFGGRAIHAELSPVTDFREACCRQYEMGECTRSGFCNFMHLKPISRELRRELYGRKRRR